MKYITELQVLMNEKDTQIIVSEAIDENTMVPCIIGTYRNRQYVSSTTRENIQDLQWNGMSMKQIYPQLIETLYNTIITDKFYLRIQKLDRIIGND